MRIVTGSARGMRLKSPSGIDVRPTLQHIKEAEFSAIQFHVPGARVLDLFAGTGQLGIEALSRGAASAVFVDASRESVEIVRENLRATKLEAAARVLNEEAFRYAKRTDDRFDVVFVDPPYGGDTAKKILPLVARVAAPGALVICETERGAHMPREAPPLALQKNYRYGQTEVWLYKNEQEDETL